MLFSGRVLLKWIGSEGAGRSVVPVAFWWVSLAAVLVQMSYALLRHNAAMQYDPDLPMFLGLSVTIVPYVRSLRIHYHPERQARRGMQIVLPACALVVVALYAITVNLEHQHKGIMLLGLAGNAIFCSRFIVAWVASEARREAVLPLTFWYLSLAGATLLLIYSLLRADLVFIVSFLFNGIPYLRNIRLIRKEASA